MAVKCYLNVCRGWSSGYISEDIQLKSNVMVYVIQLMRLLAPNVGRFKPIFVFIVF